MRADAFRIESFWADVQRLSGSCCASERPITNVATRWVLRTANLLWRVKHAELRNAAPNSLQEFSVRGPLASAMVVSLTDAAGVGAVNPIGSAHALMRVSELAAAATTTIPISAHAMAVMLFARRTGRSRSFTSVGVDCLALR